MCENSQEPCLDNLKIVLGPLFSLYCGPSQYILGSEVDLKKIIGLGISHFEMKLLQKI